MNIVVSPGSTSDRSEVGYEIRTEYLAENISELLRRIDEALPAGRDLRTDLGPDSLYFRLKDARAQARNAEREAEAAGEATSVPAAWQIVGTLAAEALARHSKDIEVAAWLLEALVRKEGFVGLATGFALIEGLIDRYWPNLHSPDTDDGAAKLAPLAGLNGVGGEGPLLQAMRMVPLIPGAAQGEHSLWHFAIAERDAGGEVSRDFAAARSTVSKEALGQRATEARSAHEAFRRLVATLDARCGADAPPSSRIRNLLEEILDAYRVLLGETAPAPLTQDRDGASPATEPDGEEAASRPHVIASREEAFAELLRIAEFFRRSEPHSPISYSLETLVRRGRMDLVDLLEELLPDANSRAAFLTHAGIRTNGAAGKKQ